MSVSVAVAINVKRTSPYSSLQEMLSVVAYKLRWNTKATELICCDFDRASSLICGNKMPTRCNRGFYCRSYCLLNMFRAPLFPSSRAQEYYTVVAACGISCCGFSSSWSGVLQHPANRTHNPQLHTRTAT